MRGYVLAIVVGGLICVRAGSTFALDDAPISARTSPAPPVLARLPLWFEPNRGQADARAAFVAQGRGGTVFLTQKGAVLALARAARSNAPGTASTDEAGGSRSGVALRYELVGARSHPRIEGSDPLPGRSNYLLGANPKQWRTDVPQYRRVRYRDVRPGVDVVYYGNEGSLEFDLQIGAQVDPADVRLRIVGADALRLDAAGNLVLRTPLGDLVQRAPVVYQVRDGVRQDLRAAYVLQRTAHGDEIGFAVDGDDRRYALVIDPVLDFGTYFGGLQNEGIYGLAVDPLGDIYVAGSTISDATTFPETVGAYQTAKKNFYDAFVAKIKDDGSALIYATYIGGDGNDFGNALAVDADGRAVLGGETGSDNYPLAAAVQGSRNGAGTSGTVTKLNAAGDGVVFSTYLGGNNVTEVFAVASDAAGATYVTGRSAFNSSFPTTVGAFQTAVTSASGTDAFVVKYDVAGARVYATLLGAGLERGDGIAVDAAGAAYVAGTINVAAINGVTANVIGPGGGGDAMIAKFNASGSALDYLTRIGGTSIEQAVAITLDAANNAYFTGHSFSSDLPSTPAAPGNTNVALFGALDAGGTALTGPGLTWYGSSQPFNPNCSQGGAFGTGIALDPNKPVAYVVGYGCPISAMPSVDPIVDLGCAPNCNSDTNRLNAVLLRYTYTPPPAAVAPPAPRSPQAAPFLASATLIAGMSGSETLLWGVRTDPVGRVTVAGDSTGTVATRNAIDASANGADDGVVLRPSYASVPPFVAKRFSDDYVDNGTLLDLTLTIANKNPADSAIALTGIVLDDYYKSCIDGIPASAARFTPPGCEAIFDVSASESGASIKSRPGVALPAAQACEIRIPVKADVSGNCPNTTEAIRSDQGYGNRAADEIEIVIAPSEIWQRLAAQGPGNMSDSTNYVGNVAPVANSDVTFPAGTATGVTNDLPAQQALDRLILTGSGFAFAGAPFNVRGGIQNSGSGNVLNTPLQQLASGFVDNSGGTLILNGAVDLAADLYVHGSGATTFGAPIGGTGAIDCAGPGNVTFGAAPTFTGSIQVSGGTLFGNAAIGQPIDAYGGGTLRGSGPFNGAVYAGEFGRLFPGIDATPVNLAIGSLSIDRGIVELAFSANNAQHSALAVTGGVAISSGLLQLDFGTAPPVSSTFSNLVTAPGTISGCFDETRAASPNVVVVAQCTASAVSALVKAVDRIFAGGFNYP